MKPSQNLLLDHFGFSEPPFPLTPQIRAFFEGGQRRAILDALLYSIMNGEGIVTVTGEVGTGKTMLSRMLFECKEDTLEIIYLAHPRLRCDELPGVLARELGIDTRFKQRSQIMAALIERLLQLHADGRRVALIVDEAHLMSPEALEEIRLINNLDTARHKLLQVVLFGQQELDQTLAGPAMRPLRERITERFVLEPLTVTDVGLYVAHRLRSAGCEPELFEARATLHIARKSRGLMRRVNILCEKSLMAAYAHGDRVVSLAHAQMASRDAPFTSLRRPGSAWLARVFRSCAQWFAARAASLQSISTQDKPVS